MPTLDLVIAGIPLEIQTHSARLLRLFADYFTYYSPRVRSSLLGGSGVDPLRVRLIRRRELPSLERLLPTGAELISETGVIRLWRDPGSAAGRYYFHAEVAAFRVDLATRTVTGLVAPEALIYPHILANTYTLFPLLLLLRAEGVFHLHAAAAISPSGKLWLICGPQRSGKTTLTASLGLAGWRPISDDSLLLRGSGGDPRIESLRKYFHLGDTLLNRWPALGGIPRRHQYLDRTCVRGLDYFHARALAELDYRRADYILLPRITGRERSELRPAEASRTLLTLGEQSVFLQLDRERMREQWGLLGRLAREAKGYLLDAGRDLLEDPLLVGRMLEAPRHAKRTG